MPFALLLAATSCANAPPDAAGKFDPVGGCRVYEGKGETTEYTVRLARSAGDPDHVLLGVQGFHPNETSPKGIKEIRLSNGVRVRPARLTNECTCGVQFRRTQAMCAYISTYEATLKRDWLEQASETGLSMVFELEDGLVVTGPQISAAEIRSFLAR